MHKIFFKVLHKGGIIVPIVVSSPAGNDRGISEIFMGKNKVEYEELGGGISAG